MDKIDPIKQSLKIGILLIDGFALLSYSSFAEPLRAANTLARKKLYEIRHIPVSGASAQSSGGAVIKASAHVGEQVDFDLLVVVAGGDPFSFEDARVFRWLRHLASRGVRLGGLSGGPVILAKAGVINGRRMTLHWEHSEQFERLFPGQPIEPTLYVIDRNRITCAGGTAPLDMMHVLISEDHGEEFASQVSEWFMHTQVRSPATAQRSGLAQRYKTSNPAVILAIESMLNHIADTLELDQLAVQAMVSPRQLNRLFRKKIGRTTMSFYQDLRLEKAREMITQTSMSATEIALATGFSSSAHFSHSFRKKYAVTPSSLR